MKSDLFICHTQEIEKRFGHLRWPLPAMTEVSHRSHNWSHKLNRHQLELRNWAKLAAYSTDCSIFQCFGRFSSEESWSCSSLSERSKGRTIIGCLQMDGIVSQSNHYESVSFRAKLWVLNSFQSLKVIKKFCECSSLVRFAVYRLLLNSIVPVKCVPRKLALGKFESSLLS